MEDINVLKAKAKLLFDEVNKATANLKDVIDEFDAVQTAIKSKKYIDLQERFKPLVSEMFKLDDKLVCAYIGNDHRIYFSENYPYWDTNTQKWEYKAGTDHAKVRVPKSGYSTYNMSVAIGVDTTMIEKENRRFFFWDRSAVMKITFY